MFITPKWHLFGLKPKGLVCKVCNNQVHFCDPIPKMKIFCSKGLVCKFAKSKSNLILPTPSWKPNGLVCTKSQNSSPFWYSQHQFGHHFGQKPKGLLCKNCKIQVNFCASNTKNTIFLFENQRSWCVNSQNSSPIWYSQHQIGHRFCRKPNGLVCKNRKIQVNFCASNTKNAIFCSSTKGESRKDSKRVPCLWIKWSY